MTQSPPGWYPQQDGRQRYWDGAQWTDHFAPGVVGVQPGAVAAKSSANSKTLWVLGGLGAMVLFMFVGCVAILSSGGSSSQSTTASSSSTTSSEPDAPVSVAPAATQPAAPAPAAPAPAAPAPAPAGSGYGNQPAAEQAVVAAVQKAQAASQSADNDLARGAALRDRTAEICAALPDRTAVGWTGKVTGLDANSDGKGVIEIEIAKDVLVKTWNNAISDIGDGTLLEPSDPLFDKALGLKKGQVVTFSGTFPNDDANCLREASLSLSGNLRQPEFILKFSDIG